MTEHIHFLTEVREISKVSCQARWIERSGPVAWPAWSPDWNLLHNSLRGCRKSRIYQNRVETTHQFSECVISAAGLRNEMQHTHWNLSSKPGNMHRSGILFSFKRIMLDFLKTGVCSGIHCYNTLVLNSESISELPCGFKYHVPLQMTFRTRLFSTGQTLTLHVVDSYIFVEM